MDGGGKMITTQIKLKNFHWIYRSFHPEYEEEVIVLTEIGSVEIMYYSYEEKWVMRDGSPAVSPVTYWSYIRLEGEEGGKTYRCPGRWLYNNHACGYYMSGSVCSLCGYGTTEVNLPTCPKCGAKMSGGLNDNV